MATLEDKLLGEKLDYYCSSSEDEDENENNAQGGLKFISEADIKEKCFKRDIGTANTGVKGVLNDFQRYKQLEAERRAENEAERLELMKKLSLSCLTKDEEEKLKKTEMGNMEEFEVVDEIMQEYIELRMQEMFSEIATSNKPKFGKLIVLKGKDAYLDAIDAEHKDTFVFVHIYSPSAPNCDTLNSCLSTLAESYEYCKFCVISTETAGMTSFFEKYGVPAVIIYKGGRLVTSFVRLTDEFGDDFDVSDVESFFVEYGYLPDLSTVPKMIRDKKPSQDDDDGDENDD